ncbi:MAG: TonB family protein [Bryobacteraceae bacterium]
MKVLVFTLLGLAALPAAVQAGDAEGCADLKLFPRVEGCVIQECSAKHHDSLDAVGGSGAPVDASTNSVSYSCPAGDLQKMQHAFDAQLRKAGYQNITPDDSDAANPALTARKGSQWIHWSANTEDGVTEYSLTLAAGPGEKFKAQTCVLPPLLSTLNQCEVEECSSKSEDSVAMPTAPAKETSLSGNVQTITLACPSLTPAQTFAAVEGQLKSSGFEILFSAQERPESGPPSEWITARTGKRWVELASAPDGESASYSLTVVPSAEVLTASAPEPKAPGPPVPLQLQPTPSPKPDPAEAAAVPAVTISAPIVVPEVAPTPTLAAPAIEGGFVPPKPILQVPIEPTQERVSSVAGYVVIKMLVDVNEDGSVTNAVLTGRITKDVRKLESAAMDAVSHWRFEPARQDGRVVPAVKIAVEMHFRGRPWRF